MNEDIKSAVAVLTEHAKEIIAGSYKNVDRIFRLTDHTKNSPEITELAETFGMMSVKVEAREYALEQTIEELKEKKAHVEHLSLIRSQFASIFINVVLLLTFYTFVLGILDMGFFTRLAHAELIRNIISRTIEIAALLIVFRMIRVSRLPLRDFGLTLRGWKRSVKESVSISAVVIGLLVLAKVLANKYSPGTFRESQIFDLNYFSLSYITYIVVAPLQEFIARGTAQSTLERLFIGKNKGFLAIVVTSFLFGSLHVYSSFHLAIAAVLTGWLWGWMYNRQKSLVGVGLSHFLIGNAAGLMGYWTFF
ncbi:MAG: type II CAAX endopeptidase family protein [bacterium]